MHTQVAVCVEKPAWGAALAAGGVEEVGKKGPQAGMCEFFMDHVKGE